jgi:putative IMPACT (imprinted ancient) family translation regulator
VKIKQHLALKKQHPGAGHFCYAYQIGTETTT